MFSATRYAKIQYASTFQCHSSLYIVPRPNMVPAPPIMSIPGLMKLWLAGLWKPGVDDAAELLPGLIKAGTCCICCTEGGDTNCGAAFSSSACLAGVKPCVLLAESMTAENS